MDSIKLCTILLFAIASLLKFGSSSSATIGFTFELIPRFSVSSPLYPGNLTDDEKIQSMTNISQADALYMNSSTMGMQDLNIRPSLTHFGLDYVIRVAVGSNPPIYLYFLVDTGSSSSWTQIEPCSPCFPQGGNKYRPSTSPTSFPLPTNHALCFQIHNGQCLFTERYLDGSSVRGIFASDHFAFESRQGRMQTIEGLVFATVNESTAVKFTSTMIAGILGMGRGPQSFAMQLAHRINGRFSYCMVNVLSSQHSYMKFGSDIVLGRNAQSTPFVRNPFISRTNNQYYLDLLDISINGQHMKIPRRYLQLHPDGTGGCAIDSGAASTLLITPIYHAVKNTLMHYFLQYGLTPVSAVRAGYDLCFRSSNTFTMYPTMDLHFRGATLHLEKSSLFFTSRRKGIFCLTMMGSDALTLIGAAQQENLQVVYDVGHSKLYFEPANCAVG